MTNFKNPIKIYFDTEFSGLQKDTDLISIGFITEMGETFYAELSDYNEENVKSNDWIMKNVIGNLIYTNNHDEWSLFADVVSYGTKLDVKNDLMNWLNKFSDRGVQLVSDVCHYDMVLFIDLFGDAFSVPKFISAVCHDINQDMANFFNRSEIDVFDFNREEVLKILNGKEYNLVCNSIRKHNALFDAKVIKAIHESISR